MACITFLRLPNPQLKHAKAKTLCSFSHIADEGREETAAEGVEADAEAEDEAATEGGPEQGTGAPQEAAEEGAADDEQEADAERTGVA